MAFQFKIQIKRITKPPVWRRVVVPETATFAYFHEIIQAAFGWHNSHLYQFSKTGYYSNEFIGLIFEDDDDDPFAMHLKRDASKVRLSEIFDAAGQKYVYIYDFGDDWTHQITLEAITDAVVITPELLAGKGACPPEDCGGTWGYENLRNILSEKKHPEHKETKEWLGLKAREEWDANYIDLEFLRLKVRRT